ncbi:MAG TPA: hypothetical protein VIH93_02715 [Thermoanaerobaculia bacterium]
MRRFIRAALFIGVLFALPLSLVVGDDAQPAARPVLSVSLPSESAPPDSTGEWTGRVVGIPGATPLDERKGAATALATFRATILLHGKRYTFTMVGSNPFLRGAKNVVVPVQIFPVRFEFPDGTVLDPTEANDCAGGGAPLDLVLQSPLFQDADYGEGPRQFVEEVRRLEFWSFTGPGALNPRYSVRVAASVPASIRVVLPAGYQTRSAPCGRSAIISIQNWQQILTQLSPQFRKLGVSAKTFPLFLTVSVATSLPNDGLAFGFHSAARGQTYGVAMWDATGYTPINPDISILSHELAEWYDDPFVNNATPPWGHVGQVSGCQANLEVGDPLSGHLFGEIRMPNGFTYKPQETAFFSWFFAQVPSWGIGGWYSSANTFQAPAALCH